MNEILELATQLGRLIAADPRAQSMSAARDSLEKSVEDRQLLADYEAQQQKMAKLQSEGKPIEPEDKHKLADLQAKLAGSGVLKVLLKAQTDYVELMTTVSRRVEEEAVGLSSSAPDDSTV